MTNAALKRCTFFGTQEREKNTKKGKDYSPREVYPFWVSRRVKWRIKMTTTALKRYASIRT